MMKAILLLVFAALSVFGAPAEYTERQLLTHIFNQLNTILKDLPENATNIYLIDLKVKNQLHCEHEVFCNAEEQLIRQVSGRSGDNFEPFRTDKTLIRNLNMFIKKHQHNICKSADNQVEIPLPEFLEDLKKCVQAKIAKKKD